MNAHFTILISICLITFCYRSFAMDENHVTFADDEDVACEQDQCSSVIKKKLYPQERAGSFKRPPLEHFTIPKAESESRDDGEIGVRLKLPMRLFANVDISPRGGKAATFFKRTAERELKRQNTFVLRRARYLELFFGCDIPSEYVNMPAFGTNVLDTIQTFSKEAQLLEFLRNTTNFGDDFKALRSMTKEKLSGQIQNLFRHNQFEFIESATLVSTIAAVLSETSAPTEANSHDVNAKEVHELANLHKLSAMPRYQRYQLYYLAFLDQWIVPLVDDVPLPVKNYFRRLSAAAESMLTRDPNATYKANDLIASTFFLYIIVPLIRDYRVDFVHISDKELMHLEKAECKHKNRDAPPEYTSAEFADFAFGVVTRMEKNQRMELTFDGNTERKEREAGLVRLLMKIFSLDTTVSSSSYHGFLGTFFEMLSNEHSTLYQKLNTQKTRIKDSLLQMR